MPRNIIPEYSGDEIAGLELQIDVLNSELNDVAHEIKNETNPVKLLKLAVTAGQIQKHIQHLRDQIKRITGE